MRTVNTRSKSVNIALALTPYIDLENEWSAPTVDSILGLAELEDNWNGQGGKSVEAEEAVRVMQMLSATSQHIDKVPFIYPSPNGGLVTEILTKHGKVTAITEGPIGLLSDGTQLPKAFDLSHEHSWDEFRNDLREKLAFDFG